MNEQNKVLVYGVLDLFTEKFPNHVWNYLHEKFKFTENSIGECFHLKESRLFERHQEFLKELEEQKEFEKKSMEFIKIFRSDKNVSPDNV